jgi:hypothetical protein
MMEVQRRGCRPRRRWVVAAWGLRFGLRRLRRRVARAHNAVCAWICKPILAAGQAPRPQAPPARADDVPRAASGARATRTGSRAIDVPFGWIEEISRQLSERSCATASAVAGRLSEDALARLPLSDTLADATRLLEAAPVSHPSPRSSSTGCSSPQTRRCDVGRNMGATCSSEPPPTSRRTSATSLSGPSSREQGP